MNDTLPPADIAMLIHTLVNQHMKYDPYAKGRTLEEAWKEGGLCHHFVKAKIDKLSGLIPLENVQVAIGHAEGVGHSALIVEGMVYENDRGGKTVYPVEKAEDNGFVITDTLPASLFTQSNA